MSKDRREALARREKKSRYNDNNRAIAYYRYSSARQKEVSIEIQKQAVHEHAEKLGYEIVREYQDKAKSGRKVEGRNGYMRMLDEVEMLKPNVLFLYQDDRLGRNTSENLLARITMEQAGVRVDYVEGEAPDLEDPFGWVKAAFDDVKSQAYADQMSDKIYDGIQKGAAQAHYLGRPVFGYIGVKDQPYAIDPKTAPVVQRIFHDYADGKPMKQIADELNAQGIRTSWGNAFTFNGLRSILHNEAYTGVYEYAGVRIEGGMPKIIEQDLYDRVQDKFKENMRGGAIQRESTNVEPDEAPRYWLTGKLFCGECGEPMRGTSGTSKTGVRHCYYGCKAKQKKLGCRKRDEKKTFIESLVVQALSDILGSVELLTMMAAEASRYYSEQLKPDTSFVDGLEIELKEARKALENILKAIENGIFNETTQSRMLELEERVRVLEQTIIIEEETQKLFGDNVAIGEYFLKFRNADLSDEEVRRKVLDYFVDKIYVYDDRIEITGWFTDGKYWPFPIENIEDDRYWIRFGDLQEIEFLRLAPISTTD